MANQTVIKLQDGNVMPQLGLGVWKAGNDEVVSAIHKALEVGYRSIATIKSAPAKPCRRAWKSSSSISSISG